MDDPDDDPLPTVTYNVPHWLVPVAHTVMLLLPYVTPVTVRFCPAVVTPTALGLLLLLTVNVDACALVVPILVVWPDATVGSWFVKFKVDELPPATVTYTVLHSLWSVVQMVTVVEPASKPWTCTWSMVPVVVADATLGLEFAVT
jgi:hypothetical protein